VRLSWRHIRCSICTLNHRDPPVPAASTGQPNIHASKIRTLPAFLQEGRAGPRRTSRTPEAPPSSPRPPAQLSRSARRALGAPASTRMSCGTGAAACRLPRHARAARCNAGAANNQQPPAAGSRGGKAKRRRRRLYRQAHPRFCTEALPPRPISLIKIKNYARWLRWSSLCP
jgi:hypothetical protein